MYVQHPNVEQVRAVQPCTNLYSPVRYSPVRLQVRAVEVRQQVRAAGPDGETDGR